MPCKRICILACGRSGTVSTTKALNDMGIRVKHELEGEDGTVGAVFWKGQVRHLDNYDIILHQVRHPLKVISSLTTAKVTTLERYAETLKLAVTWPVGKIERSMLCWLLYTDWADRQTPNTFKVENLYDELPSIHETLTGVWPSHVPEVQMLNTRKHNTYDWSDLEQTNLALTQLVRVKATNYGYE